MIATLILLLKLFARFRKIRLLLFRKIYTLLISNSTITTMDFLQDIGALLTESVEFNNDELEAKVEAFANGVAAVSTAAIEFQTAIGADETGAGQKGGKALIKLASTLGTAFNRLTPEQVAQFKQTIADVYENPDPVIDAAGQKLFDTSIDAIGAAQDLSDFVNNMAE